MTSKPRALVLAVVAGTFTAPAIAQDQPGDFDFYVLSLSWSPAYCALEGDAEGAEQCAPGASHRFVVHGLWPNYEQGYPEYCDTSEEPSDDLIEAMLPVMPDAGLIAYEWAKHGSCTGLSPQDYFATTREAVGRVTLAEGLGDTEERTSTAAIEEAFIAANPGLRRDGIAVACERGLMAEVRICLTKELEFRDCDEVDRRGCRDERLFIIPAD